MSAARTKAPVNATRTNLAWGGRFAAAPSDIMQAINASLDVDKRLYAQDIAGSLAHCAMLVKRRIISRTDGAAIARGLSASARDRERANSRSASSTRTSTSISRRGSPR